MENNTLNIEIQEKPAYSYPIIIGEDLDFFEYIKEFTKAKKILIVTNKTIFSLYENRIKSDNAYYVILEDGEEYKNIDTFKKIIDSAIENRFERRDCFAAFGGGVIGDVTGFAAASYLRGIDFIQIPTTLLAQVDSSVGGKVAINHEKGKNLIGAFYQPKAVLSDTNLLKTLDKRQLKTGLAEVLKYAFIEKSCCAELNYRFYDFLDAYSEKILKLDSVILKKLISICCTLKASVVEKDETEKGMRAVLNFGHTFAHAIENLTGYTKYTHGEAVAAGMIMAAKLALKLEMIERSYFVKINELINKYELLPDDLPDFNKDEFIEAMHLDKKADADKIRFILPDSEFSVKMVTDIDETLIKECIEI